MPASVENESRKPGALACGGRGTTTSCESGAGTPCGGSDNADADAAVAGVAVAVVVLVKPDARGLARERLAAVGALDLVDGPTAGAAGACQAPPASRAERASEVADVVAVAGLGQLDGELRLKVDVGVLNPLH